MERAVIVEMVMSRWMRVRKKSIVTCLMLRLGEKDRIGGDLDPLQRRQANRTRGNESGRGRKITR